MMSGQALATLQGNIDSLNQQGLSFIDNATLEVDTCQAWTDTLRRKNTETPCLRG